MAVGRAAQLNQSLAWQIRFTWESLNGVPHPRFTYGEAWSEDRAVEMAGQAVARMEGNPSLRLVEVHWRHISSDHWVKFE